MTSNLDRPTDALIYERDLIQEHLDAGTFRPKMAVAMTDWRASIVGELDRRAPQQHDKGPRDARSASSAPGVPTAS